MALQGWRFFGVSATIIIYIGGVLFLSMNNIPGSHPKRTRIERFAEVSRIFNLFKERRSIPKLLNFSLFFKLHVSLISQI